MLSAPARANSSTRRSGRCDHQVHVDHAARVVHLIGEGADGDRPERDRRDEMTVHDVDVNDARTRVEHLGDVGPEAGEIGGENGRRHPALMQ